MTSQSFDEAALRAKVAGYAYDLKMKVFKKACVAGAKVVVDSYRRILTMSPEVKPGGPNFLHAFQAVDIKPGLLLSGDGAYAVIGNKREGGQRLAPQILFGEKGTVLRRTKTGASRGIMPVQYWLDRAKAESLDAAREAMLKSVAKH